MKALLIQLLFSVRSETQLAEQLRYNLLYRWFVGLGMSGKVWNRSSFSTNRKRLIDGEIADRFFTLVVGSANKKGLVSSEHFSVDGTLIEPGQVLKVFKKKKMAVIRKSLRRQAMAAAEIQALIFTEKSDQMRPMSQKQIQSQSYTQNPKAKLQRCLSWATC